MQQYKVEMIPINDIVPYERNAKRHPQEQIDRIVRSIAEFGFRQNLVIDKNNVIVIGHGRFLAAKQLGYEEIPCVRITDLDENEIKALRLADNKVAESGWDEELLKLEIEEIDTFDMTEFGFDLIIGGGADPLELEETSKEREKTINSMKCPKCGFVFEA